MTERDCPPVAVCGECERRAQKIAELHLRKAQVEQTLDQRNADVKFLRRQIRDMGKVPVV
jgi:23S rRNA G2445 N2-methylase RlmL